MDLSFLKKHRKRLAPFNGLIVKNPVLIRGLALAPVIVASTTMKNALILTIGMAITMIPAMIFAFMVRSKTNHWLYTLGYMFCSAVFYIPAALLIHQFFPNEMMLVGIYLPMIVVNSIPASRAQLFSGRRSRKFLIVDILCQVLGFAIAILLVSGIREWISIGTLFGKMVGYSPKIGTFLYPFGGFMVVAFLAALFQKANQISSRVIQRHSASHHEEEEQE